MTENKMNENLDQDTKNFLSDLAVLLLDHHITSMNVTNCGDIRFTFNNGSKINICRFTSNTFYQLKSTKCFSTYIPKCMRDMPGEQHE